MGLSESITTSEKGQQPVVTLFSVSMKTLPPLNPTSPAGDFSKTDKYPASN